MKEPKYQFIAEPEMPTFISQDERITNKLVASNYNDLQSKIETESELSVIWSNANAGGSQTFSLPNLFNVMLYVINGTVRITTCGKVEKESLVVFDNNAEGIEISAESNAQFLILAGEPINEKVVQQGPFVMNTSTEILEAMRDYQMEKMGILIKEK